jgi:hypothetical protein
MNSGANYTLATGGHQYGPFTIEQLRDHYSKGSIKPTDLVWCPGMATWSEVQDVLSAGAAPGAPLPLDAERSHALPALDVEVPHAPPPSASVSRGEEVAYPMPPSLHWVFVLLLTVLTLGIFGVVWMFVHARWVRRIDPTCNALFLLAVGIPLQIVFELNGHGLLGALLGAVATTWAYFSMRSVVEDRFGMALSGIMTFFFNLLYLQYHLTGIAEAEYVRRHSTIRAGV